MKKLTLTVLILLFIQNVVWGDRAEDWLSQTVLEKGRGLANVETGIIVCIKWAEKYEKEVLSEGYSLVDVLRFFRLKFVRLGLHRVMEFLDQFYKNPENKNVRLVDAILIMMESHWEQISTDW